MPSVELTQEQAVAFLYTVRVIWTVVGAVGVYRSWGEFAKNRKAYRLGKNLRNGKKIVRKGRYRRSRNALIAFSIGLIVGLGATIQTFFISPQVQTSIYSSILTILLIVMFVCFYRAVESDVHMRDEAREFKEHSKDDPSAIHERIGEEVAGASDKDEEP